MSRLACKLLILLAVLLMPLGMAAPAASATHHAPEASMPMEHCPDSGSKPDSAAGFGVCAMACAAALPAASMAQDNSPLMASTSLQPRVARMLHGLHPETATPPPKRS